MVQCISFSTLNARQNGGDVVDRRPLVLQYVQTDLPITIDIRMEHFRHKPDLWIIFFLM